MPIVGVTVGRSLLACMLVVLLAATSVPIPSIGGHRGSALRDAAPTRESGPRTERDDQDLTL